MTTSASPARPAQRGGTSPASSGEAGPRRGSSAEGSPGRASSARSDGATMTVATPPLSRHRTGHRDAPGGRSFVKAARGPEHRADLLREAAVYDVVRDRCPATATRLPSRVRWNADADEL